MRKTKNKYSLRTTFLILLTFNIFLICYAQDSIFDKIDVMDYRLSREYEIANIEVIGVKYLDANVLAQLSGLRVGQKIEIPGDEFRKIIRQISVERLPCQVWRIHLDPFAKKGPGRFLGSFSDFFFTHCLGPPGGTGCWLLGALFSFLIDIIP